MDEQVTMRRKARASLGMRRLGRAIQASLKGDRRRLVEETGLAVEALLKEDPPNAKEAWRRMKGSLHRPAMYLMCSRTVPPLSSLITM